MLTVSCNSDVRYTQQSSEIETVKQHINNYNDMNYDLAFMADNSYSFFNTKTDSLSKNDLIAYHKANDANYSSRGFLAEDQEFEMVVTDRGDTWVNAWLDWSGTINGSDKAIVIPIHLTYKFEDGKITRELGYWDPSPLMDEMEAIAAKSSGSSASGGGSASSASGGGSASSASGNGSASSDSNRPEVTEVSTIEEMSASDPEAAKMSADQLSATVASRLRNPNFAVDENSKARIRLTVNSANQIVVLGVDGGNKDVKEFILDRLNYYHLDYEFSDKLKAYSVPVTLVAN